MSVSAHAITLSRSRWVTLVFLAVLQLLIAVDVTVVNIALPAIRDSFDVDTRQLTWVVTGYTVMGGGLLMVGGRVADLFGRRRTPPARRLPVRRVVPGRRSRPEPGAARARTVRAGRR
ncbi:MFS transporter [Streptomyces bacillaris]|uniref:MFS transporter n=1 Tax=Streptomyces cavourensis TaxID=67258 RepID=A0ABY5F6K8_9ACTN|nr:MFS transporter [Streptomyces cavourensis]UTR79314.1 MFS transporter [Streptomyces cavourensis]WAE69565.1 MFS transporter [Streptomyces cavourensis]